MDKERSSALTDDDMGKNQNVGRGSDFSKSSIGNTDMSEETPADAEKAHELTGDETLCSITTDIVEDNIDEPGNHSDSKSVPIETMKMPVESCSPAVSKIESSPAELTSQEESKPSNGTSDTESSKNLCDEGSPIGLTVDTDAGGDVEKCDGKFMFQKSTSSENRLEDLKEGRAFDMGIEADTKVKRRDLLTSGCDLASSYGLGKKHTTDREAAAESGKRSDNDFDYGIVDPLDIARQVAIEVEKEVGDYRERSRNSPEISTAQSPDSPECVSKEEFRVSGDDSNNDSSSDSDNDSKTHEETISENTDAEQIDDAQDMAISQVTEGATTEINTRKILCGFDLNQVSSEDVENLTSHGSTPVTIMSASRATTALELPGAPLQFDVNFGWKSSASSTFQPSSPHRIRENEKETHGGESSSSKKREVFLDFDLNVAENLDPSHHYHNGESYTETSLRKTEAFPLDLNHASESDYGAPQGWLMPGNFLPSQSMQQHSSSSSKQPLFFHDLNDQPSLLNSSSDNSKFSVLPQTINAFGVSKPKETEFSLFGAKVQINAKDNVHPHTISMQNGRTHASAFNSNNMRQTQSFFGIAPPPLVQYTSDLSVYGYNNIQQSGPTIPLPSAIYGSGGPIPYMVDSRGAPAIPHIMGGSVSSFPISFAQPPFAMNMTNSLILPSNGAKSSFGLNSGTMMAESGGSSSSSVKDNPSFGQFLNLGQLRPMDEHTRSTSQTTVIGQKRQEPEDGLENYGLRPYTPPWK